MPEVNSGAVLRSLEPRISPIEKDIAVQAFAGRYLKDGCGLILQFLSRSLEIENNPGSKLTPECSMTLQAFLEFLEVVLSVTVPGLTPTAFLPSSLVHIQVIHCHPAFEELRPCGHYVEHDMHQQSHHLPDRYSWMSE